MFVFVYFPAMQFGSTRLYSYSGSAATERSYLRATPHAEQRLQTCSCSQLFSLRGSAEVWVAETNSSGSRFLQPDWTCFSLSLSLLLPLSLSLSLFSHRSASSCSSKSHKHIFTFAPAWEWVMIQWLFPPLTSDTSQFPQTVMMLRLHSNAVEILFWGEVTWRNLTASEYARRTLAESTRSLHFHVSIYQSGVQHACTHTHFFLLIAWGLGGRVSSMGDCVCPTASALDQRHCPRVWCPVSDQNTGRNSKLLFQQCSDTAKIQCVPLVHVEQLFQKPLEPVAFAHVTLSFRKGCKLVKKFLWVDEGNRLIFIATLIWK